MNISQSSEAAERNKQPILEVLQKEFSDARRVLEIGSGTGQHAVFFGATLPHLIWQTSDLPENHAVILQALHDYGLDNVKAPLDLDVLHAEGRTIEADAVFSANTAHIMSIHAVERMFELVGRILSEGGPFCLYGPFNFSGRFSSDSNARFDASLRQRNPSMGIRDLDDLDRFADASAMSRVRLYAMPANNHIAVWQKS
jgi:cyclopropane fatty-acyl-phospholipid synthase-like methyltransferase